MTNVEPPCDHLRPVLEPLISALASAGFLVPAEVQAAPTTVDVLNVTVAATLRCLAEHQTARQGLAEAQNRATAALASIAQRLDAMTNAVDQLDHGAPNGGPA